MIAKRASHAMGLSFRFAVFVSIVSLCVSLSLLVFAFSSLFLCVFLFGLVLFLVGWEGLCDGTFAFRSPVGWKERNFDMNC